LTTSIEDAAGRWLRRGAAAAIAAAGILILIPIGDALGLKSLIALTMSGLLGAAVVRGWDGAGSLLAGQFAGLVGLWVVFVIGRGSPVNVLGMFQFAFIFAVPLLIGFGIGRGLARLARFD
jgi:hypothetical protein